MLLCIVAVIGTSCTKNVTTTTYEYVKASSFPYIHDELTEDLHYDILESIGDSNDNYSIIIETWEGDEEPHHNEYSNISINDIMSDADFNIVFLIDDMEYVYDTTNKDLHIRHSGDAMELVYYDNFTALLVNENGDEYLLGEGN